MTTIQDVANRAGVSIATVSRVLSGSDHPVRPALRERVLAAAAELDFRPSSLARGLAGGETRTLALLVPDIANPYYPRLSRGVEDVASAQGYAVLVCNTDYRPDKLAVYTRLLREKRVDGVLLAGGGHEEATGFDELLATGLPLEAIGRHPLAVPSVRIDNVAGAAAATEHLLALGRRRVAFIGGPADHTTVADRRQGFRQALRAAGPRPSLELAAGFTAPDGERAAGQLLNHRPRPDAVFCFNDYLAAGLVHALLAGGCRVPDDVAVIGFDDVPLAGYLRPGLSSVAVPAYELGAAAATRLLQRRAGQTVEETVWLSTCVVPRESTAAPPGPKIGPV
jgi:DNA-binding LacI/PurR family transcriptional regulator